MSISTKSRADGSLIINGAAVDQDGNPLGTTVNVLIHDTDLLPIVDGLAHADVKHTLADVVAFVLRGRNFAQSLFGKVLGVKTVVDAAVHDAEVAAGKDAASVWAGIVKETNEIAARGIVEAQVALGGSAAPASVVKDATAAAVPAAPVTAPEAPADVAAALADAASTPEVIVPAEAAPASDASPAEAAPAPAPNTQAAS